MQMYPPPDTDTHLEAKTLGFLICFYLFFYSSCPSFVHSLAQCFCFSFIFSQPADGLVCSVFISFMLSISCLWLRSLFFLVLIIFISESCAQASPVCFMDIWSIGEHCVLDLTKIFVSFDFQANTSRGYKCKINRSFVLIHISSAVE